MGILTSIADRLPLAAAYFWSILKSGPSFVREKELWRISDETGVIYVPHIRRYKFYIPNIAHRLAHFKDRYPFSDLRGALIIEVGGHVGEFATFAASEAAKIHCFEPDPIVRSALLRNVADLPNVTVHPVALSNKTGTSTFYLATSKADSSLFEPQEYTSAINVEARRLDSFGPELFSGFSKIFLKMDAEGFEPEVLNGAGDFLKMFTEIAIDVSPERGTESTYHEVKAIAEAAGFVEINYSPMGVFYAVSASSSTRVDAN